MITSTSEYNTSFLDYLKNTIFKESMRMAYGPWIQFIQEHRMLIRKYHSTKMRLTEQIMDRYQYRVRSFLKDQIGMLDEADQVFRVINKLHSDMDFTLALEEVYIPEAAYIYEMHDEFITAKSQLTKL